MTTNLAQLARAYLVFANEGAIPSLKLIKSENNNESFRAGFLAESTKESLKYSILLPQIMALDIVQLLMDIHCWKNGYSRNGDRWSSIVKMALSGLIL